MVARDLPMLASLFLTPIVLGVMKGLVRAGVNPEPIVKGDKGIAYYSTAYKIFAIVCGLVCIAFAALIHMACFVFYACMAWYPESERAAIAGMVLCVCAGLAVPVFTFRNRAEYNESILRRIGMFGPWTEIAWSDVASYKFSFVSGHCFTTRHGKRLCVPNDLNGIKGILAKGSTILGRPIKDVRSF